MTKQDIKETLPISIGFILMLIIWSFCGDANEPIRTVTRIETTDTLKESPDAVDNIGAKGEGQMTDVGKLKEWLIYQTSEES